LDDIEGGEPDVVSLQDLNGFCLVPISGGSHSPFHKNDHYGLAESFFDPFQGIGLDALAGDQVDELVVLNELDDDLCAANELLAHEHLRVRWPVRVELQPLLQSLIFLNVEAFILYLHLGDVLKEELGGLALRLGRSPSNEEDYGVGG